MKMKVPKIISAWTKYAGLSKEEYDRIRPAIYEKNYNSVLRFSGIGAVLLVSMTILSLFLENLQKNTIVYVVFSALLVVLFFSSRLLLKNKRWLATPLAYIMLSIAFAFGIVIGVFQAYDQPATSFCVLIFALPLLLVDRPIRCSMLMAVATLCFCACSVAGKERVIYQYDLVNGISFLLLGIAVNQYVMETKLRDLLNQSIIERERDTDDLTKLLTKAAGQKRIREYISSSSEPAAFIIIDVDNFKNINDTLGHAYGDLLLMVLGESLRASFATDDILARMGGDEIIIFVPRADDLERLDGCLDGLGMAMRASLSSSGQLAYVTFSAGVAMFPEDSAEYKSLYDMADKALYASKGGGKNRVSFYMERRPMRVLHS